MPENIVPIDLQNNVQNVLARGLGVTCFQVVESIETLMWFALKALSRQQIVFEDDGFDARKEWSKRGRSCD
jgi:hypothetical protein